MSDRSLDEGEPIEVVEEFEDDENDEPPATEIS